MRFVNKSKGILNFQGRLIDPGSKIFISEDSVVKYQSLLYKYYGEGLGVIEDYDGKELTVEDIRDIVAKRGVAPVRQHQKPEYMKIIEESAENNINTDEVVTGKSEPEVEVEAKAESEPEVEVEIAEKKQETKKRVTRKRNTKK